MRTDWRVLAGTTTRERRYAERREKPRKGRAGVDRGRRERTMRQIEDGVAGERILKPSVAGEQTEDGVSEWDGREVA